MELFVGNIYSTLVTTEKKLINALRKKYSVKVPGYSYTPQYRSGRWDGTKYYISNKGKFRTGLLQHILEDLDTLELKYTIKYVDKNNEELSDYTIDSIELRPYQECIIEAALDLKRCIVQAPTGSGKTFIMASILKAMGDRPGIIMFNQKQILVQTYEIFKKLGFDVGIAFGEGVDIKPVTLCTVQSIDKVMPTHLKTAEFIMVDEVHEFSKGELTTAAIGSFPKAAFRYGFTATVPSDRMAKLNLVSRIGQITRETSVKELVSEGYLASYNIRIVDTPGDVESGDESLSYMESYDKYIINNKERNNKIAELVEKIREEDRYSRILILVKNLSHASTLHKLIEGSFKLEGKDSMEDRNAVIKKFKDTDKSVLIGTKILQTGVDIPHITDLINARGLRSEIATIQALGRGLRLHQSKDHLNIIDFMDKAPYLEKHSKSRIKIYNKL